MSHTGNGASKRERPTLQEVEQGTYPQESSTRVTSAGAVSLTTPQSRGWATRIGHGSHTEHPQELPARQVDQVDACTTQIPERKAQIVHSARKRKECPTEEKQMYNQSRYTESTQTTLKVQASWEAYSHCTPATQASRPIMESERIQHQGQPRDRILLAHGKGSTGNSSDVPDVGKMAASLQKVQATAPFRNTSRGDKGHEGDETTQSLELKQGESGGISGVGYLAQVHHFTQKWMTVYVLEWCYQKQRGSARRITSSNYGRGGRS